MVFTLRTKTVIGIGASCLLTLLQPITAIGATNEEFETIKYVNVTQHLFETCSVTENAEREYKKYEKRQKKIQKEKQRKKKQKEKERKRKEAEEKARQAALSRFNNEEINLIAKTAYAEAGNQSDYGIRLVIDCIMNRVDSPRFGNSVYSVITARGQFSTYANGAISRAPIQDRIVNLIKEEMVHRTNTQVLFFTAGGYNPYCIPMFREGAHYFGR